jgi:hypothetical protein
VTRPLGPAFARSRYHWPPTSHRRQFVIFVGLVVAAGHATTRLLAALLP